MLGEALDSPLSYTTGGSGTWTTEWGEGHNDTHAAYAPSLARGQESWMQTGALTRQKSVAVPNGTAVSNPCMDMGLRFSELRL